MKRRKRVTAIPVSLLLAVALSAGMAFPAKKRGGAPVAGAAAGDEIAAVADSGRVDVNTTDAAALPGSPLPVVFSPLLAASCPVRAG